VLALLGSGVLARSHAHYIRRVRPITEIRVWSPNAAHARACAQEIGGQSCASAQDAVRGADIICTVTHAHTPVLEGAWLKAGAFVAAVGAPRPDQRELDDAAMAHWVVADSREAAEQESGDVIGSGAPVQAELGEVISGRVERPPAGTTVIFKSLGQAVEDAVAASLVWQAMKASA
jgi:thiomorpholine-carboxylate dehydrogenase